MTDRTDNFTRANTTTNIGTPSDGGSDWVQLSGTWGIISNAGYKSNITSTWEVAYLESSVSDVNVQATLASTIDNAQSGVGGRIIDSTNYLGAIVAIGASGTITLWKIIAGVFTQLGSTYSGAVVSGDVIKLRMSGSNLTVFQNGISRVTATDSTGLTNTKHGLIDRDGASTSWNTFSITGVGAPPVASSAKTIFIMP